MRSWRSGAIVEKKLLSQWFIRTAVFAEQLTVGLDSDQLRDGWRDIIDMQKHWIGSIQGYFSDCEIVCDGKTLHDTLRLWFSSPENLLRAQFAILQQDHHLAKDESLVLRTLSNGIKQLKLTVVNPCNNVQLPVFVGGEGAPIVPESSDLRVDENLTGNAIYESISTNDWLLEDIRKGCESNQVSTFLFIYVRVIRVCFYYFCDPSEYDQQQSPLYFLSGEPETSRLACLKAAKLGYSHSSDKLQ